MKIEIKNTLKLFAFLVCLLPVWTWAADYKVSTSTTTVDGDTFCGGSACTSSDTIIIRGGARGSLKFQDFDGAGSYITITNENVNPDSKVVITGDASAGWGVLNLYNCKYVDLKGNNDGDITYGIKVNNAVPSAAGTVWVYGESDHIKLSYLEVTCEDSTSPTNGIFVQDNTLSSAWTFDTFEIHHNYVHDTRYCAMYLGRDNPPGENNPYVAGFSIHDNIMEDLGSYGITYKGINGPNNYIYNNIVKRTGLVPGELEDHAFHGIGVQATYGGNYVEIYDNWVEKTVGPSLKIGGTNHLVHDNILVGCGTGDDPQWGCAIVVHTATNQQFYDNIIIQAKRYGIYGAYGVISASHKRNLIGDCGSGEAGGSNLTEGTGDQANTYESDVSNLNFKIWSDDRIYSNDVFSLNSIKPPTGLRVQ